jgi:hypothetical protein
MQRPSRAYQSLGGSLQYSVPISVLLCSLSECFGIPIHLLKLSRNGEHCVVMATSKLHNAVD